MTAFVVPVLCTMNQYEIALVKAYFIQCHEPWTISMHSVQCITTNEKKKTGKEKSCLPFDNGKIPEKEF